ncbi:MAG TPA: hypothetical protein VNT29_04915 [Candidatus Limnocylindrales bacterium]|nr:hypothetical protein [Candidatus Limnocylindrales bacterium]
MKSAPARFPQVRCTAKQLAELKRRAKAARQTVSDFVRSKCCE